MDSLTVLKVCFDLVTFCRYCYLLLLLIFHCGLGAFLWEGGESPGSPLLDGLGWGVRVVRGSAGVGVVGVVGSAGVGVVRVVDSAGVRVVGDGR